MKGLPLQYPVLGHGISTIGKTIENPRGQCLRQIGPLGISTIGKTIENSRGPICLIQFPAKAAHMFFANLNMLAVAMHAISPAMPTKQQI